MAVSESQSDSIPDSPSLGKPTKVVRLRPSLPSSTFLPLPRCLLVIREILNLRILGPSVLFRWVPEGNRKFHYPPFCMVLVILMNHPLSRTSDPLVHHGRHFGRTVHAMCNVPALVTNGVLIMGQDSDVSEESLTTR